MRSPSSSEERTSCKVNISQFAAAKDFMADDEVREAPASLLVDSLKARDAQDGLLDAVISDYELLHGMYRAERQAAIQLRQDLDGLRQRPSLMTDIPVNNIDLLSDENREWLKSVERSLVKLQEELSKAYSIIKERDQALATSHKQQQDDEVHIERLSTENEMLLNKLTSADAKLQELAVENERLKQMESKDVLQEKFRQLEKENRLLLLRIQQLSDERSSAMNEMNEIVLRTRSLLNVDNEPDKNVSEESSRILDPDAWVNLLGQDVTTSEYIPSPRSCLPRN